MVINYHQTSTTKRPALKRRKKETYIEMIVGIKNKMTINNYISIITLKVSN